MKDILNEKEFKCKRLYMKQIEEKKEEEKENERDYP
jgi:hypothetical protein